MTETFEGTTLHLIHEAREEIKKLPESDPKVQELNKRIQDLINDLLWYNDEYVLSNRNNKND
jgi:hypothetical protein